MKEERRERKKAVGERKAEKKERSERINLLRPVRTSRLFSVETLSETDITSWSNHLLP